jgi:hypothetical protein
MSFRLVALDLDGTLLDRRYQVSVANREALEKMKARDIGVVLVTGRSFAAARPIALGLHLDDVPLVCHNGALTKIAGSSEIVDCHVLPDGVAAALLAGARAFDVTVTLSDQPAGLGRIVLEGEPTGRLLHYIEMTGTPWLGVASLEEHLCQITERGISPIHVTMSGQLAVMSEVEAVFALSIDGKARFTKAVYPRRDLVIGDFINPACSKKTGLEAVARHLDISADEILAIGDNHNDLEMLRYAGKGVVMGNAADDLQGMGFDCTDHHEADGVAKALDRWVLG